jgi:hypothetical protein
MVKAHFILGVEAEKENNFFNLSRYGPDLAKVELVTNISYWCNHWNKPRVLYK